MLSPPAVQQPGVQEPSAIADQSTQGGAPLPECVVAAREEARSLWQVNPDGTCVVPLDQLLTPPRSVPRPGRWRDAVDVSLHELVKGTLKVSIPTSQGDFTLIAEQAAARLMNLEGFAPEGAMYAILNQIKAACEQKGKRVVVLGLEACTCALANKSYMSMEQWVDKVISKNKPHQIKDLTALSEADAVIAAVSHGEGTGVGYLDEFTGCHWLFAIATRQTKTISVYDSLFSGESTLARYGRRFAALMQKVGVAGEEAQMLMVPCCTQPGMPCICWPPRTASLMACSLSLTAPCASRIPCVVPMLSPPAVQQQAGLRPGAGTAQGSADYVARLASLMAPTGLESPVDTGMGGNGPWTVVVIPKDASPQQPNFCDCGYYAGYVGAQITAKALGLVPADHALDFPERMVARARAVTQAFIVTRAEPLAQSGVGKVVEDDSDDSDCVLV
jgi:hypothetical protein